MNNFSEKHLFVCTCSDIHHQLVVTTFNDLDWEDDGIYVEVHLNTLPFHKRLWVALCYIFGRKSKYGAFQEIILSKDDSIRLANILFDKVNFS